MEDQNSETLKSGNRNPWAWIPSLYFAEGLPYVMVMIVSVIMYKNMGIGNTDIAFYTSWLYLPWVIKPLWSPFLEIVGNKRQWVLVTQFLLGVGLASVALTLPAADFFRYSLAVFWLLAFSSATHDIAADGLYLLVLNSNQQAFFVGIRSTFYRISTIAGQGLLVVLAGYLEMRLPSIRTAWALTFGFVAVLYLLFFIYHRLLLPREASPVHVHSVKDIFSGFWDTFRSFFQKPGIGVSILFLMTYRLAESQLVKLASPFLLDSRKVGGLGMNTQEVGLVNGTFGVIALLLGGILGGVLASRGGLKKWIWWMLVSINLPNLVYVYLAFVQPVSFAEIAAAVSLEQFGYGFGFTGYMLYMLYISQGTYSTAHYALTSGFMALGMMLPGMLSGWVQDTIGYQYFFIWVMLATIPSFVVTAFLKIDPEFGVK